MKIIRSIETLNKALNYNFGTAKKFEFFRRKDNRCFRFCLYDGKNYDDLYVYLQNGDDQISIFPEYKMKVGEWYNINGESKCVRIYMGSLDIIISDNPYLVNNKNAYFIAFNMEVARWILENYPGVYLKHLYEVVHNKSKATNYDTIEALEVVSANPYYGKGNVWFLPAKFRDLHINVQQIPEEIVDSYLHEEECYQQYRVFEENGLKGVKPYGFDDDVIVNPEYEEIILENKRAYLKNKEGYWAEFNLVSRTLKCDFIYESIEFDASKGYVCGYILNKKTILHSKYISKRPLIFHQDNCYGLITDSGNVILEAKYDWIQSIGERYEIFCDGKYGLADSFGNLKLDCIYSEIKFPTETCPLIFVCKDDKWGIVDINGQVYADFEYDSPDEETLIQATNEYINKQYRKRKLISTVVIRRNPKEGKILMKLKDFNREFTIYRRELPKEVYERVMSNYPLSLRYLGLSAINVDDSGELKFNYNDKEKWYYVKKVIDSLSTKKLYETEVVTVLRDRLIVKILEPQFKATLLLEGSTLTKGDKIMCKVRRKRWPLELVLVQSDNYTEEK